MVCTLDGQETQVLDDDDSSQPEPGPLYDIGTYSLINKDKIHKELNAPMIKDEICEELNAPTDDDINHILFGETQALDDPYDWGDKTQLDPIETQLYGETQVLEDGMGMETQLIEDMGNWIETQLVEEEEEEERETQLIEEEEEQREKEGLEERDGGEEREMEGLEERDGEEREREDLEERDGGEEREREGLEEREREYLEEREREGLEEIERKDPEEIERKDSDGRERKDLEEREGDERENSIERCEERESSVDSDASTDDDDACDSIHKRVTSLRVASLRSGARAASSNFKSKLNTFSPNKSTSQNYPLNEENLNIETQNDGLVLQQSNNKTARQLFADVVPETDCDGGTVPVLSYVESQEPGILSQANALELVDKLISSSDVGLTQDINNNNTNINININNNNINNKNSISSKLVQVAKNVVPKSPAEKKKIFEWNNMNEDGGGGEFFTKYKDLFIDKSKGAEVKSAPPKGSERKKAKSLQLGRSDSRVILNKRERACKEKNRKSLFDERENDGEVLERENQDVGPDTQMAVEAIQELVHGGPGPSKGSDRTEENTSEIVYENRRKTRSGSVKIVEETTKRARTRSGKIVLQEGKTVEGKKKRKEVSNISPKKLGNFEKTELEIGRRTRSCSKVVDLLGQNVNTPDNLGQIAKCKKKRTSYTISPSNSEKKKRIFIRSATELLDKAKRQKRVYSSKTEEELILPDKGNDKSSTKIVTPSRVINEKSPVFSPQKSGRNILSKPSVCRELLGLGRTEKQVVKKWKDLRVRKDLTGTRVLLSNHLDDNVLKQQKKILGRLGVLEACNISEATHFIADKFVRTRNMLEAIAMGKYVVTPVWLERCNLSNQYVDEKNFILRDLKKEKEIGFCMSNSLAISSNSPLLKGHRVVITRNVKPSQEVVTSLVLASGGQPMERIGRSLTKENKVPNDILVISCEEDYETCIPLLEKGGEIFSSELLLNGIIIQKLEFERHMLFSDHVKKTRSTIWLKDKQAGKFLPVTKCT